jgi:hypothetical protein
VPHISETVPVHLTAHAEAARAWFSETEGSEFELTGIVDPGAAPAESPGPAASELQLILCGERGGREVCLRERFSVSEVDGAFDVTLLRDETPEVGSPAPLLDPPAGVRAGWLDQVLPKHAFTVLLFYRGFW